MVNSEQVIIRANSTIKLAYPTGMTSTWTFVKGTTAKQMLDDIAHSLGYEIVVKAKATSADTEGK